MSTVGSITSAQDPLYVQSVQAQNTSLAPPQRDGREAFEARLDAAAQNAGLSSSQVSQLHTDLQNAIQGALQGASGTSDQRGAVKDAVDSVLKKYGIDPAAVKPQHTGRAHHHHGAGKATAGKQQGNDGDADDPSAPPQNATDEAVATLLKGLPSGSLLDAAA